MASDQSTLARASSTQTWSPPPQSLQQPHRPHHQQNLGAQPAGLAQYPAAYDQPLQPYNRVYQPVPYSQQQNQPNPEQLYQWQERQRVPEPKGWKWTKVSLHILSFMLSIIGFGLALSLIRYNAISLPPLACGPVLGVATLWSAAELITLACRKFMAGIHPGAHVGISLVLWLGGGGCGGWTMSEAPAYVSRSTAAAVLTLIVAFIHLVLFIGACVDTAKRNSLAKRPILVANWPPYTAQALQPTTPQQSPHQQQKQQQPQQQQRTQIEQDKDGPVEIRTASPVVPEAPAEDSRTGRHEVPTEQQRPVGELSPGITQYAHSAPVGVYEVPAHEVGTRKV